jgi:ribosome maturation factor RimP
MGYELVGVEYFSRGKAGRLLRVYIDRQEGITVDDCAAVSRQLSAMLDVEDPIAENYELEVSSPGLDRPLIRPEDFVRFAGERVRVRLSRPLEGRRNFEGTLIGLAEGRVELAVDEKAFHLVLDDIDSARLVPKF